MFSGIVEEAATVAAVVREGGNLHLTLRCSFTDELKIDQSVAHNGVCLTVVAINGDGTYTVTAIEETLRRSNLGDLRTGDLVNVERCMVMNGRLDGHIVQGHVDCTAVCTYVEQLDGSSYFRLEKEALRRGILPYTMEHTNFCRIAKGTRVNLEFDIIGKYIARISSL